MPDGTAKIKCGELLTSLTLELKQRISGSDHVTVTIPMATVAWVKDNDDKKMLGLKFCENIGRNNLSYRNNLQAGQDNPTAENGVNKEDRHPPEPSSNHTCREQRRSERVAPAHGSVVVANNLGSANLFVVDVNDISISGARLTGSFPTNLQPGMTLGPLTFNLFHRIDPAKKTIIAQEAVVAWSKTVAHGINQTGVRIMTSKGELLSNLVYGVIRRPSA